LEFRVTKENDILELSSWFKTQVEIKNWGGPLVRFPFTLDQFKKDIGFNIITSYSLVQNNELLGFIQIFDKFGCSHIGRVIVNPKKRSSGLGLKLIQSLFQKYKDTNQNYSLFVYKHNSIAINLYKKLGFEIDANSSEYENENNCFFMQKQITPKK